MAEDVTFGSFYAKAKDAPREFPPLTDDEVENLLVHAGPECDPLTGALTVPIYQTTTFRQRALGELPPWAYSRSGNPTRQAVEDAMAQLENGAFGFAFASGMAAVTAVVQLLVPGQGVVISDNVYGGTYRILDEHFARFGIRFAVADTSSEAALAEACDGLGEVGLVLVETPANPLLTVTDIAAAARIAHERGAWLAVDNTFMSPYLQRPLELGADIVVHSATKYLGGHSDVIAGFVVVRDAALAERVWWIQNSIGAVLGPEDCYLVLRGIKTLGVRLDRSSASALAVARFLDADPRVAKVYYPGLPDHPGFEVQRRQAKTAGAMVSFDLGPGLDPGVFLPALETFVLAESLGGVESLSCQPSSMTHFGMPPELREGVGITDALVRLSVGLEPVGVLVADLDRALDAAASS